MLATPEASTETITTTHPIHRESLYVTREKHRLPDSFGPVCASPRQESEESIDDWPTFRTSHPRKISDRFPVPNLRHAAQIAILEWEDIVSEGVHLREPRRQILKAYFFGVVVGQRTQSGGGSLVDFRVFIGKKNSPNTCAVAHEWQAMRNYDGHRKIRSEWPKSVP